MAKNTEAEMKRMVRGAVFRFERWSAVAWAKKKKKRITEMRPARLIFHSF